MKPLFRDRQEAGRALASSLRARTTVLTEPVVLALPRGGVPVAFEVARSLRAPLDVCVVRRLEVPGSDGIVMGALASDGVLVLDQKTIDAFEVSSYDLTRVVRKQARELTRREKAYRGEFAAIPVAGRTAILIDDGIAATSALTTAISAIRARRPERLIVASPVAAESSYWQLLGLVDDAICLEIPTPLHAVSSWYAEFSEVSDLDVRQLHAQARSYPLS